MVKFVSLFRATNVVIRMRRQMQLRVGRSLRDPHTNTNLSCISFKNTIISIENFFLKIPPEMIDMFLEFDLKRINFRGFNFSEILQKSWELIFADFRGFILI